MNKTIKNQTIEILPSDFYSNEKEKIKLNWFCFEYAVTLYENIKVNKNLFQKLNKIRPIKDFCIYFSINMKPVILDKLAGKTDIIEFDDEMIEDFYQRIKDKDKVNLIDICMTSWDNILEFCCTCPTRCISEKDNKADMFDDSIYNYER